MTISIIYSFLNNNKPIVTFYNKFEILTVQEFPLRVS